jgi:hypothetical protein
MKTYHMLTTPRRRIVTMQVIPEGFTRERIGLLVGSGSELSYNERRMRRGRAVAAAPKDWED